MCQPNEVYKLGPKDHCFAVAWSPFEINVLAVVSGTNYGLRGAGRVDLVELSAAGPRSRQLTSWRDVVTDVTWSESSPTVLVAATGDATLLLLDTQVAEPRLSRQEHLKDVSSVSWSLVRGYQAVLSTSWDGTAKQWNPEGLVCTQTYPVCPGRVYEAAWSPLEPGRFAVAAGDGVLSVWSCLSPGRTPVLQLPGRGCELLSCDWSRYTAHQLAAAGVDGSVTVWDLRQPGKQLHGMTGHTQAVRRVRYSAFDADLMATVSYDKTCRLWSVSSGRCLGAVGQHSEFIYGLDWSVLDPHVLATGGWDSSVQVHRVPAGQPPPAAGVAQWREAPALGVPSPGLS